MKPSVIWWRVMKVLEQKKDWISGDKLVLQAGISPRDLAAIKPSLRDAVEIDRNGRWRAKRV